jgi:hypothetical protein
MMTSSVYLAADNLPVTSDLAAKLIDYHRKLIAHRNTMNNRYC